jgi:predicted enzyme related to lactoylglutathione lyase
VLRTRDIERATEFYCTLMGWTIKEAGADHRFFQAGGKTVASVVRVTQARDTWAPHASVSDLAETTAQATRLGGTLVDTIEIKGVAATATLQDSEGTVFGLWQPAPHPRAELTGDSGSLWWIEVLSDNVPVAREFYCRLFGWTAVDTVFDPFASYIFFKRGDDSESGILPIEPEWGIRPRWNSIFAVEDCDATVSRALQLGADGEFVHTVPKYGRIGNFNDPGGAVFLIRGPLRG